MFLDNADFKAGTTAREAFACCVSPFHTILQMDTLLDPPGTFVILVYSLGQQTSKAGIECLPVPPAAATLVQRMAPRVWQTADAVSPGGMPVLFLNDNYA